jgi:hypothetical protein
VVDEAISIFDAASECWTSWSPSEAAE